MKKILLISTGFLVLVGLVNLLVPFVSSLKPSKQVLGERPKYDLSLIDKGSYRLLDLKRQEDLKVLIIHDWDGKKYTYIFPSRDNKIPMPGNYWGPHIKLHLCADFRPELEGGVQIQEYGLIKCHDKKIVSGDRENWEWRYNGEKINQIAPWVPGLPKIDHEIVGNYLYLNY